MSPEILREIMDQWNVSDDSMKSSLKKRFLQHTGDVSAPNDWLAFLAGEFGIDYTPGAVPGLEFFGR